MEIINFIIHLKNRNVIISAHGNYGGGCGGGSQGHVIGYITDCGGIDTEESYPYDAMVNDQSLSNS